MSSRAQNGVLARGDRKGALAPDERLFNRPAREERAGDADHAQDHLLRGGQRRACRGRRTAYVAIDDVV